MQSPPMPTLQAMRRQFEADEAVRQAAKRAQTLRELVIPPVPQNATTAA